MLLREDGPGGREPPGEEQQGGLPGADAFPEKGVGFPAEGSGIRRRQNAG